MSDFIGPGKIKVEGCSCTFQKLDAVTDSVRKDGQTGSELPS